jgi:hypothetical protein
MGIAGGQPLIRVRSELASERLGGATGPALEGIHAPQTVPSWPTALAWTGVAALAPRPVTACWMPSLMLFKLVSSILKPSDMATSYKARGVCRCRFGGIVCDREPMADLPKNS